MSATDIDAPMKCERCGEMHNFREQLICITEGAVGAEDAPTVVDRVAERLGGATHEEAVARHPLPSEQQS